MNSNFNFKEQLEQSAIKTEIVSKYFKAWAHIMANRAPKIAYIDLFAGPGIYDDGTKSTPIIITEAVLHNPKFYSRVLLYFNEKDEQRYKQLKENINSISGIEKLKYSPYFHNITITYSTPNDFMKEKIPSFCFFDPAGYKGLSLDLIYAFGKDHGTDIIFFFNFNEINRGINNPKVKNDMEQIFGKQHYTALCQKLENQHGQNRESIIVNEMAEAIKSKGIQHVLPFRFKFINKERTSHYIIFCSKNITAYMIMKDIMYSVSEKDFNGIGRFEFIPSCDKSNAQQLSIIDFFNTPFNEFKQHLLTTYTKKTMSVQNLIRTDSPYTRFVASQYKDILKQLENDKIIFCSPENRRKNTMGDKVLITFP